MRIYIDMVGDLFHYGHINMLKKLKYLDDTCNYVIVGIHSDEDVRSYKRVPILTMEERIKSAEGCKFVDRVVPNAPITVTPEYLDSIQADIIVHGNDISDESRNKMYGPVMDRYRELEYTAGISTTDIIQRIKNRQ